MDMVNKQPKFFVFYKNWNNGKLEPYDIINPLLNSILTPDGKISDDCFIFNKDWKKIPVRTKEQLYEFIDNELHYHYWAKCEWEFIAIDWPYSDTIEKSRPVKMDVYEQIKPNLPVIVDLVWNYVEPKFNK